MILIILRDFNLRIENRTYRLNSASALTSEEWRYKIEGVQVGPVQEVASTDVGVIPPQISWTQPAPEERFHQTYIFGEVTSAKGKRVEIRLA